MKRPHIFLILSVVLSCGFQQTYAQQTRDTGESLSVKQQHIITIASLTAQGDLVRLESALSNGLDAGLTVNQVKEVLVHLYAYCGFPRGIRGLQTCMAVLQKRKAKGISDSIGPDATPISDVRTKYERGKNILEQLTGLSQEAPPAGYSAFAPVIDTFLKEHLFADIFERDVLSHAERELVTISVLSTIGGVEPMLRSHLSICLNVGLTGGQLQQFIGVIKSTAGGQASAAAQAIVNEVIKSTRQR